jgi:GT2 family glycosyltransferase
LPPEVSIITVYYNSPEDLLSLHRSMREHLAGEEYEWIIADNASEEDLESQITDAVYLRLQENYGFAKANNFASEKAQGKYLFFINPDCVFTENCLPPLKHALQTAGISGPRVINEDGTVQLSFGPFLSFWNEFQQKKRMQQEKTAAVQNWIQLKGDFFPDYVSGCALMITADLYQQIGGFDEHFFLYEEDVDLCKRVHDLGKRVAYVSSTTILHGRNKSVQKTKNRARSEYLKSQSYYYKKHHGFVQNLLLRLYRTFFN